MNRTGHKNNFEVNSKGTIELSLSSSWNNSRRKAVFPVFQFHYSLSGSRNKPDIVAKLFFDQADVLVERIHDSARKAVESWLKEFLEVA